MQKNTSECAYQVFLAINNICFPKNLIGELMYSLIKNGHVGK
jgi:hypothetical protein